MKRVAIIHQLPLEYYPPATNLLDCLSRNEVLAVEVYSTANPRGRPDYENADVRITRFPFPRTDQPSLLRLVDYARFIFGTIWKLAVRRPRAILYIEPHSALPVYFYKRIINPRAEIFHHCHEYYPAAGFKRPGMRLANLAHRFETGYLYDAAEWISQTNPDRVRLFLKDHPEVDAAKVHSLPNYPPTSWKEGPKTTWREPPNPLRLVYVGSISLEDTYIRELCDWVARREDEIELDIYAYNVRPATDAWLKGQSQAVSGIRYFDSGLAYEDLPGVLSNYHVGLILYRGNTENFVWNAPNKLFEYLACGLDVWYPPVMRGMDPHLAEDVIPKVLSVDYEALDSIDLAAMTGREGLTERRENQFCDSVLRDLEAGLMDA